MLCDLRTDFLSSHWPDWLTLDKISYFIASHITRVHRWLGPEPCIWQNMLYIYNIWGSGSCVSTCMLWDAAKSHIIYGILLYDASCRPFPLFRSLRCYTWRGLHLPVYPRVSLRTNTCNANVELIAFSYCLLSIRYRHSSASYPIWCR